MPSETPLLTIAIPTYNRATFLERLLSSISTQSFGREQLEILVSDNASPDSTPEIVQSYIRSGLDVRYIRNPQNIGPDANFLQCFQQAAGTYVWIVGDDDALEPGALHALFPLLSSKEFDLVHLKPRNFKGNFVPHPNPPALKFKVFNSAEDLAKEVHVSFTFISGNIINKATVSRTPHPPLESLVGSNLVQLGWTYAALDAHRRSAIIQEPLIAALTDNTGGYELTRVFGTNLARITEDWLRSPSVKQIIIRGALQKFIPYFLLGARQKRGAFACENTEAILSPQFGRTIRYRIFIYPLIRLPLPVSKSWFQFIRVLNKLDTMLGSPMLGI